MVIRQCQWDADRLAQLQKVVDLKLYKPKQAHDYRKSALTCPEPLPKHELQALADQYGGASALCYATSALTKRIAFQREHLQKTVFAIQPTEQEVEYYLFVLALLQPCQLFFLALSRTALVEEQWSEYTFGAARAKQGYDYVHAWSYEIGSYICHELFDDIDISRVFIVRHCVCEGPQLVVSNAEFEALEPWLHAAAEQVSTRKQPVEGQGRKRKHVEAETKP
eukprot:6472460-Amphidinium_carterae.1